MSIDATRAMIEAEQRRVDVLLHSSTPDLPPATRALLIGPHPDDNLFAAGGTAIRFVERGIPQHWVCVTDGRACVAAPSQRAAMALARAEEERNVARALGISEPEMYAIPEDELARPDRLHEAAQRLRASLRQFQPDAVFTPYFLETHPLHRLTTHLTAVALRDLDLACTVYSWAEGSLPPPSFVIDITDVMPRKLQLVDCYTSQLRFRDYHRDLQLLGRIQARQHPEPAAQFCDLYFAQPREEFVADVLSRQLDAPETLAAGPQPMIPESPAG